MSNARSRAASGAGGYVELHAHSVFSLLDGASQPEALVARAHRLGLPALALTDHDDLGGAVRFGQAAAEAGIGGIVGVELTVEAPASAPASSGTAAGAAIPRRTHLVLLAEDRTGYGHLATLVTRARLDAPRGEPVVPLAALDGRTAGLFALTGCPRGWVPGLLADGDPIAARTALGVLADLFDGRVAVEVWNHHLPEERRLVRQLVPLARAAGLPWVVTNDVHYAEPGERVVHDVLCALRHQRPLDAMGTRLRPSGEWYLKSARQLRRRWRHDLAGIDATLAIAERCAFRMANLRPRLPRFPLPPGVTELEYLTRLVEQGAEERWGRERAAAHDRQLRHELDLIGRLGLAGYFLIVWDIVRFARREGILCQGRGSAANSAVCYCLGITAVDPVRMELLFERFLSEERQEAPDIDLDFAHRDRERVLQYVYERYGREHAAMVCEQITYRGRSAVRDAARVLGFSTAQADALSALSDRFSARATAEALRAGSAAAAPNVLTAHGPLRPETGERAESAHARRDAAKRALEAEATSPDGRASPGPRAEAPAGEESVPPGGSPSGMLRSGGGPAPGGAALVAARLGQRMIGGTEAITRAREVAAEARRRLGARSGRPELAAAGDVAADGGTASDGAAAAAPGSRLTPLPPDADPGAPPVPPDDARTDAGVGTADGTVDGVPADAADTPPPPVLPARRVRHGGPRDDQPVDRPLTASDRPRPRAAYEPYGSPNGHRALLRNRAAATPPGPDDGDLFAADVAPMPDDPAPDDSAPDDPRVADSWRDPHAGDDHVERRNPTTALRERTPAAAADTVLARAGLDPADERVRVLADVVEGLHQAPRHRSIHVGGFVLTEEPLSTVVPIEPASMPGRTVIQWEKDDLDPVGLVKIDLLGLGMLTVIQDCLTYVRATRGVAIDLARLDMSDQAVYDDLCRADTVGVFQVESRAQMNTLPRLRPRCFYDLVVEVALIRPGPIQGEMVHPYLRRRAGTEPVTYPHPKLEPILKRTLGVPLFQEQGMQVAIACAGFTPGEADNLRRAMGHKRSRERMAEICERLVAGMRANGIPEETARRIYNQINAFADYGFPESHAASFALLVYASAYLKHYYAPEFTAALLNAQPMGFYAPGTIIEDARRHGVEVRAIDLTRSAWDHVLELPDGRVVVPSDGRVAVRGAGDPDVTLDAARGAPPESQDTVEAGAERHRSAAGRTGSVQGGPPDANGAAASTGDRHRTAAGRRRNAQGGPPGAHDAPAAADHHHRSAATRSAPLPSRPALAAGAPTGAPALRFGLRLVRGLGPKARATLERALADGPFRSIPDVLARTSLDRRALRALAGSGAFDAMVADVPPADRRRVALWRVLEAQRGAAGPLAPLPDAPAAPPPLPALTPWELTAADYRLTSVSLNGHPMRHLRALVAPNGVRTARDAHAGRDGTPVAVAGLVICRQRPGTARGFVFLTLEDETGWINIVVTPQRFERQALMISTTPLLLVRGVLQVESGVVNVRARSFRALEADLAARSHDFR